MNLNAIKIIKADEQYLTQMAELVSGYLGTCSIQKGTKDIFQRNVDELLSTIHCYNLAIDGNNEIIGLCGISDPEIKNDYGLKIGKHRDVLYVVVKKEYQKKGIGTMLLQSCIQNMHDYPILYEAWGEIKNGDVHSHNMLEKCAFKLLYDLGTDWYRKHGYCDYCINKDKNCHACYCKIFIRT